MSPDRWNRLRSLYDLALDHAPEERLKVLSSQAGADTAMVDEVLRLIEQDDEAGDFLQASPAKQLRQQLSEAQPLFEPGQSVAQRFHVIRLIGSGGMGEVYEAEDTDLGERIALKTLRVDRLADPKAHHRLRREALLARKITHPNVCRIFDILRHRQNGEGGGEDVAVLTMEFLSGVTLAEHLKQHGPFTPVDAEPIIRQILSALTAAHESGVIHRDLKPSNIMLVQGRAVVTDFGLAINGPGSSAAPQSTLTNSGQLIGTPEYMAPEQIRNQPVTPQSDIYSLGVVMYEMLTGQRPTQGASGLEEILNRVLEAPPSPRAINPAIPRRWEAIILRCLDRDPLRRHASASALLEALDARWQVPRFRPSRRDLLFSALSVAGVALGTRYWGRAAFSGPKLILAPMENRTNDRDLDNAGALLEHQLGQSAHLQIPRPTRMSQLRQQLGLVTGVKATAANYREMALRDGASGAIFASLSTTGADYELHVRLEEAANTPLRTARTWSKDFTASSKQELFSRVDDAARWLRQQSGESLTEISRFDRPSEDTTTNSWPAWRLYADSKRLAAAGDLPAACAILTEATRLDPLFAMAWRDLADYLVRRHEYTKGYAAWESTLRALDQRQNTSVEALRIRAMYCEDTWQHAEAEKYYRTLLALLPNDYPARLYLGSVVANQGRLQEALNIFETGSKMHPTRPQFISHIAHTHLALGDLEKAQLATTSLNQTELKTWADYSEYVLAMAKADHAKALSTAKRLSMSVDPAWQWRGPLVLASCFGHLGQLSEAKTALLHALERATREGTSEWLDRLPLWILYLDARLGTEAKDRIRQRWIDLARENCSPVRRAEFSFVAQILDLQPPAQVPDWPELAPFRLSAGQIKFFANPSPAGAQELQSMAKQALAYIARDLFESVAAVAQHKRWSDRSAQQALLKGYPAYWWGSEFSIPAKWNSENKGWKEI